MDWRKSFRPEAKKEKKIETADEKADAVWKGARWCPKVFSFYVTNPPQVPSEVSNLGFCIKCGLHCVLLGAGRGI